MLKRIFFIAFLLIDQAALVAAYDGWEEDQKILNQILDSAVNKNHKIFGYKDDITIFYNNLINEYKKTINKDPNLLLNDNFKSDFVWQRRVHESMQFFFGHRKSLSSKDISMLTYPLMHFDINSLNMNGISKAKRKKILKNRFALSVAWLDLFSELRFKSKYLYEDPDLKILSILSDFINIFFEKNSIPLLTNLEIETVFRAVYELEDDKEYSTTWVNNKHKWLTNNIPLYKIKKTDRPYDIPPIQSLVKREILNIAKARPELFVGYFDAFTNLINELIDEILKPPNKEDKEEIYRENLGTRVFDVIKRVSDKDHQNFLLLTSCILGENLDIEYKAMLLHPENYGHKNSEYMIPFLLNAIDALEKFYKLHKIYEKKTDLSIYKQKLIEVLK